MMGEVMINSLLQKSFKVLLSLLFLCQITYSSHRPTDDNDTPLRRTFSLERSQTLGSSQMHSRRGTLAGDAAELASTTYRARLLAPSSARLSEDRAPPSPPIFLTGLQDNDEFHHLDRANKCLNITEVIGSRVLSNMFLGAGFFCGIVAGGFSQFYDPEYGKILLYVSVSCSSIGALFKQISDTKMRILSDTRERTIKSLANQAASENATLQASLDRTKEKLRVEKERKNEEAAKIKEALEELQGRTSGTHSPAGLLFLGSKKIATPDALKRVSRDRPTRKEMHSSGSNSPQSLRERPKKRTKKGSVLSKSFKADDKKTKDSSNSSTTGEETSMNSKSTGSDDNV